MKYSHFEEVPVWKAAIEFALNLFQFTNVADFRGFGDTKNQLERATVLISSNIAEGFERGANAELIYSLYISKGSAAEVRSMLRLCEYSPRFSNFKFEISNLIKRSVIISTQLSRWIESLKNSKIKGNGFLTKKDREEIAVNMRFSEFDAEMKEFRRQHLETLEKRQQDTAAARGRRQHTASSSAEIEMAIDPLAAGIPYSGW